MQWYRQKLKRATTLPADYVDVKGNRGWTLPVCMNYSRHQRRMPNDSRLSNAKTNLLLPYELRLGVAGHRALAQPEAVEKAVTDLVAQVERMLRPRDHVNLEWTVVSPLAMGADQIVARAVLEKTPSRLEVITPFPVAEYRRDFTGKESLDDFERLLRRAAPDALMELFPNADPQSFRTPEDRGRAYLRAGRRVVDSCEILIVVWDGQDALGKGGTGDVVRYALSQGRVVLRIDPARPNAPAERVFAAHEHDREGGEFRYRPLRESDETIAPGFHQLVQFLADQRPSDNGVLEQDASLLATIHHTLTSGEHAAAAQRDATERVLQVFRRADRLAERNDSHHNLTSALVFVFAGLAVCVTAFQVLFHEHEHWIIVFEILFMGAALFSFLWGRRKNWHEKWLRNRYLAEQIRIGMASLVTGRDTLGDIHEPRRALEFYRGPKSWLGATVQRLIRDAKEQIGPAAISFDRRKKIAVRWIDEQRVHHLRKARSSEDRAAFYQRGIIGLFGATVVAASVHLSGQWVHGGLLASWATFFAIALPTMGATVHAIAKQREYERIAERSVEMTRILERLRLDAEDARTPDDLSDVVVRAARTMMIENYEWWVLLSFNPPELAT